MNDNPGQHAPPDTPGTASSNPSRPPPLLYEVDVPDANNLTREEQDFERQTGKYPYHYRTLVDLDEIFYINGVLRQLRLLRPIFAAKDQPLSCLPLAGERSVAPNMWTQTPSIPVCLSMTTR